MPPVVSFTRACTNPSSPATNNGPNTVNFAPASTGTTQNVEMSFFLGCQMYPARPVSVSLGDSAYSKRNSPPKPKSPFFSRSPSVSCPTTSMPPAVFLVGSAGGAGAAGGVGGAGGDSVCARAKIGDDSTRTAIAGTLQRFIVPAYTGGRGPMSTAGTPG